VIWKPRMPKAISNTSPLLYLYRVGAIDWLPQLFEEVWIPPAVAAELQEGLQRGYNVPTPEAYSWLHIVEPRSTPSQWFALDLGPGELATIALALENPHCIVLLDDAAARRIAQAAKLQVWGTLKILLEAKSHGLIERIAPVLEQSSDSAKSRIVSSSYKGCTNALRRNHEARNVQRLSA
jgi:predicted nucleic acid-binding protein